MLGVVEYRGGEREHVIAPRENRNLSLTGEFASTRGGINVGYERVEGKEGGCEWVYFPAMYDVSWWICAESSDRSLPRD